MEIEDLVAEAKNKAKLYLDKFLINLGLDKEAYNHLYEIDFKIGKTELDAPAMYEANKYEITLNDEELLNAYYDYVDILNEIADLTENKTEESQKEIDNLKKELSKIINECAINITHELIHENRTIFIEASVNTINIDQDINREYNEFLTSKKNNIYNKYTEFSFKGDINTYNNLLEQILNKPYAREMSPYIPLKITATEDGKLNVVAYREISLPNMGMSYCYEIFKKENFDTEFSTDADAMLISVANELNNPKSTHRCKEKIIPKFDLVEKKKNLEELPQENGKYVVTVFDYDTEFKGHFDNREYKTSDEQDTLSIKDEYGEIKNNSDNIKEKIEFQNNFEEVLTETIAFIAGVSYNDELFDLNKTCDKIMNYNIDIDMKLATKMIKELGIDVLRWFMTSAYDMAYENKFNKIFEEKYERLLKLYSRVYKYSTDDKAKEKIDINQTVDEINEIVEEKVTKKRF